MKTVTKQALLKRAALSQTPAILVGPNTAKGAIDVAYHQRDLLDTMQRSTDQEFCSSNGVRNLFAPAETTPRCLYHGRGDSRELVNVFCPDGEATIRFAGDKTHMYQVEGLSKTRQAEVLEWLNQYRILRDVRQKEWQTNNP